MTITTLPAGAGSNAQARLVEALTEIAIQARACAHAKMPHANATLKAMLDDIAIHAERTVVEVTGKAPDWSRTP